MGPQAKYLEGQNDDDLACWGCSYPFAAFLRPKRLFNYNLASDLIRSTTGLQITGKIVAHLKFAFWENIFTRGQDNRIWNVRFRTCFPGAPTNQLISQFREIAYDNLQSIRRLRNQIVRHGPISRAAWPMGTSSFMT